MDLVARACSTLLDSSCPAPRLHRKCLNNPVKSSWRFLCENEVVRRQYDDYTDVIMNIGRPTPATSTLPGLVLLSDQLCKCATDLVRMLRNSPSAMM